MTFIFEDPMNELEMNTMKNDIVLIEWSLSYDINLGWRHK